MQAADDRCGVATTYTFAQRSECVALGLKLAGVHWCVKSFGHAAELTAGYYNTAYRNGYRDVMAVLARHGAHASFTCVEMRDSEHPPEGACGPEALLNKVIETAAEYGVRLTGENALQRCAPRPRVRACVWGWGGSVMQAPKVYKSGVVS